MSDRTGRKRGSLDPVITFEAPNGYLILAPQQIGEGLNLARRVFAEKYEPQGWRWREWGEGGLQEVAELEKRLIRQENERDGAMAAKSSQEREVHRRQIQESLKRRMVSPDTSAFEKEFIDLYLNLRDDAKRDKYAQALKDRNYFLWALNMDQGTKVEDRMKSEAGDIWRPQ